VFPPINYHLKLTNYAHKVKQASLPESRYLKGPIKLRIITFSILTYILYFVKLKACKKLTHPEFSGFF